MYNYEQFMNLKFEDAVRFIAKMFGIKRYHKLRVTMIKDRRYVWSVMMGYVMYGMPRQNALEFLYSDPDKMRILDKDGRDYWHSSSDIVTK